MSEKMLSNRALLVEDDASLRMLLGEMLKQEGIEVDAFPDAESAWDVYKNKDVLDYRLMLLDWVLPGESGLDLCKKIRQRSDGQGAYIWMITSKNTPEDLLQVLQNGANEYLSKPLDIHLLTVRIQVALKQSRLLQEHYLALRSLEQSREHLERRVTERTEQMRSLSSRLIEVQESQQQRISREIHDELGQAMTALKMDLIWLRGKSSGTDVLAKIDRMVPLVSHTIGTIQRICAELRPGILDDLGLVAALEWVTQEFDDRTGILCHLNLPEDLDLPSALNVALFRITQESMTNIMRHADATKAWISLSLQEDMLTLRIRDNGKGMAVDTIKDNPRSIGLLGMQERLLPWQGRLDIVSELGVGTTIAVTIGTKFIGELL